MDVNVPETYGEVADLMDMIGASSDISDSKMEDSVVPDICSNSRTLCSKYPIHDISGYDLENLESVLEIKLMEFAEEDEAYSWYNGFANSRGFSVRIGPSSKSRVTRRLFRKTFYCSKQGFKKRELHTSKCYSRKDTRCGCLAKLVFLRDVVSGPWRVKMFHDKHNHEFVFPNLVGKLYSHNSFHRSSVCTKAMDELLEEFRPSVAQRVINSLFKGCRGGVTTQQLSQRLRHLRSVKEVGECARVFKAFVTKQQADPGFFYAYDLNDDLTLKYLFWSDSRSQLAYGNFCDIQVFDVTYRTNSVGYPFAPFTGLNHHYQSTLFGCAFLSNERDESFVWLFEQFLRCMKYKSPSSIITDQDRAICNAVGRVIVNSSHHYCMWHLRKHMVDHMQTLLKERYPSFKNSFFSWLELLDSNESEMEFQNLISKYDISSSSWLVSTYAKREHWLPCLLNQFFWAGMNTSQRSESINSFFDGFVNSSTPLSTFVEQYDRALACRRNTEEDSHRVTVESCHYIHEKVQLKRKAARCYTSKILIMFEEQWDLSENMKSCVHTTVGSIKTFLVGSRFDLDSGKSFKVVCDMAMEECLRCCCSLFQTKGIPYSHLLHLIRILQFDEIPDFFIMKRWTILSRYVPSDVSSLVSNQPMSSSHLLLSNQVLKVLDMSCHDSASIVPGSKGALDQSVYDINVRDPQVAIRTNGHPKELNRHPSWSDKNKKCDKMKQSAPKINCFSVPSNGASPSTSKGSSIRKQRQCSNCGLLGHYRTSCLN